MLTSSTLAVVLLRTVARVGLLAVGAGLLVLAVERGTPPVLAHSPHPGLDFSIGVDRDGDTTDDCTTKAGGPSKCSLPTGSTFTLKVYLNSLGGVPSYKGFDIYVEYAGVSSKNNPDASSWPDCVFQASRTDLPGVVVWGCAIGVAPAGPSTYTGLIGTTDFNCTASGSLTMVHGHPAPGTALLEDVIDGFPPIAIAHAEGEGTTETLTTNCVPVGGISQDANLGALPLEASDSSGINPGWLAGIIAGGAAAATVLGATAWCARRRFATGLTQ